MAARVDSNPRPMIFRMSSLPPVRSMKFWLKVNMLWAKSEKKHFFFSGIESRTSFCREHKSDHEPQSESFPTTPFNQEQLKSMRRNLGSRWSDTMKLLARQTTRSFKFKKLGLFFRLHRRKKDRDCFDSKILVSNMKKLKVCFRNCKLHGVVEVLNYFSATKEMDFSGISCLDVRSWQHRPSSTLLDERTIFFAWRQPYQTLRRRI